MSERKPLTLEELREMVGKPVWVETERRKEWCILWGYHGPEVIGRAMIFTTRTSAKNQLSFAECGKSWYAYAYEPPRIDRSAWEPCEFCEDYSVKYCENCGNQGTPAHKDPCKSCYCANNWEPKKNFCSACGRPLTDAAWEMLEKRLESVE